MPRIPQYTRADGLSPTYPSVAAAGAGFEQLGRLGQGVSDWAAQRLEQKKRADDAAWISTSLSQIRGDQTQRFLKAQAEAPAGAPDFTPSFMAGFEDQAKAMAEGAPSPEARALYEERLAELRDHFAAGALTFEGGERVRKRTLDLTDSVARDAATVRADPGQYDEALIERLAAIQSSDLPAAAKDEMLATARGELATAKFNALIDRDPARARAALLAGDAAGELSPAQAERLLNNADVEIRRREAEARAAAAEAKSLAVQQQSALLRDAQAMAEQGRNPELVSEQSLGAAFGADTAKKIMADLTATRDTAIAANGLALLPPAERAAEVAKYAPAAGEGFADRQARYETMLKAAAQVDRAYAQDPAGAAFAFSPTVQQAFKAADDSGRPEDLQRAVELSLAVQANAGIPATERRALSERQAQIAVETLKAAPAEQAADLVQGQAAAYGAAWPQVYGELVKAGLPAAYRVLATTDDAVARKDLAGVLAVPPAELKKQAGDKAGDIEAAVDQALAPFAATQSFFDRGGQIYADYRDAVLALAYKYGASQDAARAAEQAARVVTDKYDFVMQAMPAGGAIAARAPRDRGGAAADMAVYVLQQLKPAELRDPGGLTPETLALTPEMRRELYRRENVAAGTWITNERDDGWLLLDDRGQPVTRADGKRVEFLFADILPLRPATGGGGYFLEPAAPAKGSP